jgi:hypothetical protein
VPARFAGEEASMVPALLLPFLGSLVGKVAASFLSSLTSSSPAPEGPSAAQRFHSLLGGSQAARPQAAGGPQAGRATADGANALAIGHKAPASAGFGRTSAIVIYQEQRAP